MTADLNVYGLLQDYVLEDSCIEDGCSVVNKSQVLIKNTGCKCFWLVSFAGDSNCFYLPFSFDPMLNLWFPILICCPISY